MTQLYTLNISEMNTNANKTMHTTVDALAKLKYLTREQADEFMNEYACCIVEKDFWGEFWDKLWLKGEANPVIKIVKVI